MTKKVLASLFILSLLVAGCAGGGYGEDADTDEPVVVDETTTEEAAEEVAEEAVEEAAEDAEAASEETEEAAE